MVSAWGISLDTTIFEGQRHKEVERRFQMGNEAEADQGTFKERLQC